MLNGEKKTLIIIKNKIKKLIYYLGIVIYININYIYNKWKNLRHIKNGALIIKSVI